MIGSDLGWAGFRTFFELRVVQSVDETNERYFIYTPGDVDQDLIKGLALSGRVLDRLHLNEIPFIVIYSDFQPESAHHMGWGVFMADVEEWKSLLKSEKSGIVLCNELGHEAILAEKPEGNIYDLDILEIEKIHFEKNIHIYFLPVEV